MSVKEQYQQKRMAAVDAIRVVRNGDTVVIPTGVGEPPALLTALSEARRDFRGVHVAQILPLRKYAYIDPETAEHVRHTAYFFGGSTRAGGQEGWIDYLPSYFSELPTLISRNLIPVDVVFSMASPMDEHGFFSLSLGVDYTMAAVEKARAVVLEVNPNVPFANGDCHIHISQVAALTESEDPDPRGRPAEDRPGAGSHRQVRRRHDSRRCDAADRLRRHSRRRRHAAHRQA